MTEAAAPSLWLVRDDLQRLVDALRAQGRRVLGPVVREGVLRFDEIRAIDELPEGWSDEQSPGRYRLAQRADDDELFGVVSGPGSLKPHVFAPREPLLQIEMDAASGPGRPFRAEPIAPDAEPLAILGVRACDLAGARGSGPRLPRRSLRRPELRGAPRAALPGRGRLHALGVDLLLRVDGHRARAARGAPHDIALTELDGGFVARAGSDAGAALLDFARRSRAAPAAQRSRRERERLSRRAPRGMQRASAARVGARAALRQSRSPALGRRSPSAACRAPTARWSAPPASATTCATNRPSISSGSVRVREWDSCFNVEHSPHPRPRLPPAHPRALPAVAGPQAGELGRSVRHLGLRRLRALHRVVPRRHRPHRGGRRDRGDGRALVSGPPFAIGDASRAGGDRRQAFLRRRSLRLPPATRRARRARRASRSSPGSSTWSTRQASARSRSRSRRIPTDLDLEHTIRIVGRTTQRDRGDGAGRRARRCADPTGAAGRSPRRAAATC